MGDLLDALVEDGEFDKIRQWVRTELINSGWRDKVKEDCKGEIHLVFDESKLVALQEILQRKESGTVDLVREIKARGRQSVPNYVKTSLLHQIQSHAVPKQACSEH